MGPPSYMLSVVDRNVLMRRIPVNIFFILQASWHPCVAPVKVPPYVRPSVRIKLLENS